MGIRLQCPNGHQVHVRSHLAGQRGVCPQCGATFDIPADPNPSGDDGGGDEIALVAEPAQSAPGSVPAPGKSPARATGVRRTRQEPAEDDVVPASLDLDALAAAGGSRLFGSGPAGQRLASRQKSAQTMRRFTLALTIAVTLLACVLLFIVFR